MKIFLFGVAFGIIVLGAIGIALYFTLRRLFERASHRVADDIGRVLADLSAQAEATPFGRRATAAARTAAGGVTHLGAYAAAKGVSEAAARREFADSIERIAKIMDSAIRIPL